ncbi:MAG: thioredoxin family protein [Flavobacteriales bacterium]|jgi:peroxiredoxin|tara:strand:+ start:188 stop:820 length:633 start_codon:yes stop_codon:yes gene_type:complete
MKKITTLIMCLPFLIFAQNTEKSKNKNSSFETISINDKIPEIDFELESVNKEWMTINSQVGDNGLLVIFTCNTCPFVVMWEDRYKLIEQIVEENNIGLVYINSNYKKRKGDDSFENMQKHAKKMDYQFPYLLDEKSKLANLFGAKTTPHIFLFNNKNTLVFKGAIDDNYKDIKEVEKFYLKDAIKQLTSGSEITISETKAVGCSIKRYIP